MRQVVAAGPTLDSSLYGVLGVFLLTLFGYLFKELRRKDEGVWALLAERDARIAAKDEEIAELKAAHLADLAAKDEEIAALRKERQELEESNGYWRRRALADPTNPDPPTRDRRRRRA